MVQCWAKIRTNYLSDKKWMRYVLRQDVMVTYFVNTSFLIAKIGFILVRFSTHITGARVYHMVCLMLLQSMFWKESLSTGVTLKFFNAGVIHLVLFQSFWLGKRFAAHIMWGWFLACVHPPLVSCQRIMCMEACTWSCQLNQFCEWISNIFLSHPPPPLFPNPTTLFLSQEGGFIPAWPYFNMTLSMRGCYNIYLTQPNPK